METIQDLFEPNNNVKIREDPEKGVYLEGVQWIKVNSTKECGEAFISGEKNRMTACTSMNAHSSRSHALLIAKIEKNLNKKNIINNKNNKINNQNIEGSDFEKKYITKSFLYLVDLAGSERVNKTNAKNMRLEEAKKINSSLLILGNCIQSLIDPRNIHVSYRDSKLTRILQESLGGNAKTSLIITISPSNFNAEETVSTLNFGTRAMKVKNKPIINQSEDYQIQLIKLQEEYDKLTDDYSKLKINYDNVCDENYKLKNGEILVNLQKENIKEIIKNRENFVESFKFKNRNSNENYFFNIENNNNLNDNYKENKIIFDLDESNKELNKKLNDLELELLNMKNEYEIQLENKNMIISNLNHDKELLNIMIETMKRKSKDILEEKDILSKEKSELFTSYSDILNYNEELKIEVESLKEKYEGIKKEFEIKIQDLQSKNNKIYKNESIQTFSIFEENTKKILEKMGINNMLIYKNDINSILKIILNQYNKYVIDKNLLYKYEQENKTLKVNQANNINEIKKLNIIILTFKNDKKRLENLISEKENEIINLEKTIKEKEEKEDNLNNQLEEIKKDYEMKEENINNKLLILSNLYKNLNIIQKEIITLNKIFESDFKNKNNKNELNKIKEQIIKIETLFKNSNNNNNIEKEKEKENETLDSISLNINNLLNFLVESYNNLSRQLYNNIKNNEEKSIFEESNLKRKFVLQLKDYLEKYSKMIQIHNIKSQYNEKITKYNEMNLFNCINFILSIFDSLIMTILNNQDLRNYFQNCSRKNKLSKSNDKYDHRKNEEFNIKNKI